MLFYTVAHTTGCLWILGGRIELPPSLGSERFKRAEARLVGHLATAFDPIAEIDVGERVLSRGLDQMKDHVTAEARPFSAGGEEAVDGGKSLRQLVREAGGDKCSHWIAKLEDEAADRAVLDHVAIVVEIHERHFAVPVAGRDV